MSLFRLIALVLLAGAANGHDARPLSVTLVEQTQGVYRAIVRAPPTLAADQMPAVRWPAECESLDDAAAQTPMSGTPSISFISCPQGLANHTLEIEYPLYNPSLSTILRLETLSGASVTTVLPPDRARWVIPPEPTWLSVAVDYVRLGFVHIWEGPDHLLFVAGLMLLAARPRRIVWAVTGFTAAHSLTLSLAALGFVNLPIAPTEAMIALSIALLAGEIAKRHSTSLSRRYPVVLSCVFGLLHGMGFASALGEIGLPQNALATGLLFFNVGVELGQLGFIAAVAVVVYTLGASFRSRAPQMLDPQNPAVARVGAYMLGVPAAFWFIERSVVAFGGL